MNVLHVITGLNDGGAEAVLYRLCTHDSKNQHMVVSLMNEGKYGPLLRAAGLEVHCLRMPQGRVTLRSLWRMWRLLRIKQPNVVQTWMPHADLIGGVMARLAGVSAVCWGIHHTTLQQGRSKRGTIMVARLCAWFSHWIPHAIVSCSHKSARVQRALGYSARKFTVIPNGYDLASLTPDATARKRLRAEWGIDETTPLIGMVARFDPPKDHANLIVALAQLASKGTGFQCVLVGTGVDAKNVTLCEAIDTAGLAKTVHLLGRRDDIPAVMNALDLHVLSSLGEAFPNVLAEAMACGTPCLSTDVGDAALIIGDTGWVVPPNDSDALAKALAQALANRSDRIAWQVRQHAARDYVVRRFDITRMVERYRTLWQHAKCGAVWAVDEEESL